MTTIAITKELTDRKASSQVRHLQGAWSLYVSNATEIFPVESAKMQEP